MKMNNVGGIRPKRHKKQPEFELQCQICRYLRLQYPKVIFLSDTVASVKLTMGQATRNKQLQKSSFKITLNKKRDLFVSRVINNFSLQ